MTSFSAANLAPILILVCCLILMAWQFIKKPAPLERVLVADIFSTWTIATCLGLAIALESDLWLDFALIASVVSAASTMGFMYFFKEDKP